MTTKDAERTSILALRDELVANQGNRLITGWQLAMDNETRRPASAYDIEPEIHFVKESWDKHLWNFYRFTVSSAPFMPSPGRHVHYFIRDKATGYVLAIGELASAILALKARDDYLGISSFTRERIQSLANLGTAVALPTYAHVLMGKLTALASLSAEVEYVWRSKYDQTYGAVVTTSLYGKSSQYNRLKPFVFVGKTAGNSSLAMPDREWRAWRDVAIGEGIPTQRGNRHEVMVRLARLGYDIPETYYTTSTPRGIYVALTAPDAREFFGGERDDFHARFDWFSDIAWHWKDRWFAPRLDRVDASPRPYSPVRPGNQGVMF